MISRVPSHEVIMTGELAATGGGKQYLAIMRYFPTTITVHVNDTVEWTNPSPDEPHTITFNGNPSVLPEPPAAGPVSTPGGILDPTYSAETGTYPNANGTAAACGPGNSCFNSGLIGPASQDQTGLPQTPTGLQRVRVKFVTAGTYDYFCIIHDELGMKGEVIVLQKRCRS